MKTQETDTIVPVNHVACLAQLKGSLNRKEIPHPFKKIELPLFSTPEELEVTSVYNENFLYSLFKRSSEISMINFSCIGILCLSSDFLKLTNFSNINLTEYNLYLSDKNFFTNWWSIRPYENRFNENRLNDRAPYFVLYFDNSNKMHMDTFGELSDLFRFEKNQTISRFSGKTFSRVQIPAKLLTFLSW